MAAAEARKGKPSLMNALLGFAKPRTIHVVLHLAADREPEPQPGEQPTPEKPPEPPIQ